MTNVYHQEEDIFSDLGIGKEKRFYYPWHPDGSPNICQDAITGLGLYTADDDKNPTTRCNEFVFTRQ